MLVIVVFEENQVKAAWRRMFIVVSQGLANFVLAFTICLIGTSLISLIGMVILLSGFNMFKYGIFYYVCGVARFYVAMMMLLMKEVHIKIQR